MADSGTTDSGASGSDSADSDAAEGTGNEDGKTEASDETEETGETEKTELPTGDASEGETETGSGDGDGTKKVISISGVTIEDKNYDGAPIAYTGTPVIKDAAGNTITCVIPTASYAGTLADGADAGNNYTINYVNVTLTITEPDVSLEDDPNAKIRYDGTSKNLTWTIDYNGRLTIKGTGDYAVAMSEWCDYSPDIKSAKIEISGITSMEKMFFALDNLKVVDFSNTDTSHVKTMKNMFYRCEALEQINVKSFDTGNVTDMSSMFEQCRKLKKLDLSNFDTSKVINMSGMFAGCGSLTKIDLSSFDMGAVDIDYNDGFDEYDKFFNGCNSLSYIRAPKKRPVDIILPTGVSGTDQWYQALNTSCTNLPKGQAKSIELYKNGYPGDGTTAKAVSISGISIKDAVYNGRNVKYFGTPVVTDSAKNKITDVTLTYLYTGTLADGSVYAETTDAPSNVGTYKLAICTQGSDYSGQASCSFRIEPRTIVVSAPSISIDTAAALSDLAKEACTIFGLLDGDTLTNVPTLEYSESNISTVSAGRYGIIPSGAFAGYNYNIEYKEGTLTVGDPDDDSSFDEPDRAAMNPETNPALKCTIANIKAKVYDGAAYEPAVKVTVTGKGNYTGTAAQTFIINPLKAAKITVKGVWKDSDEDGQKDGGALMVTQGKRSLKEGRDYTLEPDESSIKNNKIKVTLKAAEGSDFMGSIVKT